MSNEIQQGEMLAIEELEFPEDNEQLVRVTLRGERGGVEYHVLKLQGVTTLARRRWLLKQLRGKKFKKASGITWKWANTSPTTYQTNLTPYDGVLFLSRNNGKQRPFIVSNIEEMAEKMRAGHWHLTHQALGFWAPGEHGVELMYDGQNRCLALIISETTSIPMIVTLGMPTEAVLGTDEGHRRKTIDNVVIGGLVDTDQLAELPPRHLLTSTCRCLALEATGQEITSGEALSSIIHLYFDHFRATAHIFKSRFSNSKLLRKGPVLAAFLLAHRRYPKQTMDALEQIAKGAVPGDNQNYPIRRINQFLINLQGKSEVHTKGDNGYSTNSTIIYKILNGLRGSIQGKAMTSLPAERQALRFFYTKDADILDARITGVAQTGDLFESMN